VTAVLAMLPFWIFGTLIAVVGAGVTGIQAVGLNFIETSCSEVFSSGYVLAAVYSVGSFTMSTYDIFPAPPHRGWGTQHPPSFRWVPFLWAIVQTSISIMG
jgi:hypothetical protein